MPCISNAVLHPNSTTGTLTASQVLWPTDCTYYLQRLRLLTNALMCCMLALLIVWPGKSVLLSSPSLSPHHLLQSLMWADTSWPFWNSFRSCASQVGSLSLDTALPPPIVHLLRLRTPLCMTTFPPGTLNQGHLHCTDRKMAEMAAMRFASSAIPSTSKLEASSLLKTGGIQRCLLLWRELLWAQRRERERGNVRWEQTVCDGEWNEVFPN